MAPTPPPSTAASVAGAWQLLALRRPELALAAAEQLLATDPAATAPQLVRIEALFQLRAFTEAEEATRALVAQAPQLPGAFYALARATGEQGELKEAEVAIREALRLAPREAAYHACLAQLHYLRGRPQAASAAAGAGLFIDPHHPDCLLWRAMAQEHLNNSAAADSAFEKLFHFEPDSAVAHTRRGKQLLWRCEPATAATHLTEALRLAPARNVELVPLLQRAVREQQWPGWLRQHQRQARLGTGIGAGWHGLLAGAVMPWYRLRSW